MTRSLTIVLALTLTAQALATEPATKDPPVLTTLHDSPDLYVVQDESGNATLAVSHARGWLVLTPHGSGQVVGGSLDGIEATAAIYYMATGTIPIFAAPHPNPHSPLLQCIAAGHQACPASEGCIGGICSLTCEPFSVICKACDGSCGHVVAPQGLMLYLTEGR